MTEPEKKQEVSEEGRKHHVRVRCRVPGCDAHVFDIRRHLKVHVARSEVSRDILEARAQVMLHGKKKTLTSLGNPEVRGKKVVRHRKKWRPHHGCSTVCVRMDKHLQNVHKMKPCTVQYKICLKEANPYRGLMEL